jgi:cytochrome c peroxidase
MNGRARFFNRVRRRGACRRGAAWLLALTMVGCTTAAPLTAQEKRQLLSLSPLPAPPPDPTNRWADDPRAADLGRDLFFDARFSADGTVSCATCHRPGRDFTDGRELARGLGDGTRHTPGLANIAQQPWLTWDGRADSLWSQALHPFESPREMGMSRGEIIRIISEDAVLHGKYRGVFGPFPASDDPQGVDRAFAQVGKAIAAYERTIRTRPSAFDRWIERVRRGDESPVEYFGADAVRGARLFVGRARCIQCHNGPNFSDGQFHMIGVPLAGEAMDTDRGRIDGVAKLRQDPFNAAGAFSDDPDGPRAAVTRATEPDPQQWGQFRTPTLRNVARTAPYMHQGQVQSLQEVIRFYSTLEGATALDHHGESTLVRLDLTPQESADLLVFLQCLTGEVEAANPAPAPGTTAP